MEIKPLRECEKLYPGIRYAISLDPHKGKRDAQQFLLESGIPRNRIANYSTFAYAYACSNIYQSLMFVDGCLAHCCGSVAAPGLRIPKYDISGDAVADVERFIFGRAHLIDELNPRFGGPAEVAAVCARCENAVYGWHPYDDDEIVLVNFTSNGGDDRCNFKCVYCSAGYGGGGGMRDAGHDRDFIGIFREFARRGKINRRTVVMLSCGEPALHTHLNEILSFKETIKSFVFFSNCSIYSENIAGCLDRGRILTSIDAGTAESFRRVKGVDAFERTCENIRRYSEHGEVGLKYIVLPGINDSQADIYGIVNFAKSVGIRKVSIALDAHRRLECTPEALEFMAGLHLELNSNAIAAPLPYLQMSVKEQLALDQFI
jgi:pyruvate-formate lyase-activating enzyme